MTDTANLAPVPPTQAPEGVPAPSKIPLIAIIFSGVGFLFAVIPATSGIAWLLLLTGTILGIIGLTRKGTKKILSIAAIVIGVVGWIISIIVFLLSAAVGLSNAIDSANDGPSVSQGSSEEDSEEPAEEAPADDTAGIGDTVTSGDGVAFTVNAVTCGLTTVGASFTEETAKGEFCEIQLVVENGTDDALSVSSYDFKGAIGGAEYETNSIANKFGEDYFATDVNPGLSTTATVYFDVPAGSSLDTVTYLGLLSFDDALVVTLS